MANLRLFRLSHATQCTYENNFDKERYHVRVLGCFGSRWFEECLRVVLRLFAFYVKQERYQLAGVLAWKVISWQVGWASLRLCADVCFSKLAKMTFKAGNSKKTSQTSLQRWTDDNENGQKATTTTLHGHHGFLYLSLPSLNDNDVKLPNFTLFLGRTWTQDNDPTFLFLNFDTVL